ELAPSTMVTWFVSADGGTHWTPRWRVRANVAGTTFCEITNDSGTSWQHIGSDLACGPEQNLKDLWTDVPAGSDVRWRAELTTAETTNSPRIATTPRGTVVVLWEADARPDAPIPE